MNDKTGRPISAEGWKLIVPLSILTGALLFFRDRRWVIPQDGGLVTSPSVDGEVVAVRNITKEESI